MKQNKVLLKFFLAISALFGVVVGLFLSIFFIYLLQSYLINIFDFIFRSYTILFLNLIIILIIAFSTGLYLKIYTKMPSSTNLNLIFLNSQIYARQMLNMFSLGSLASIAVFNLYIFAFWLFRQSQL